MSTVDLEEVSGAGGSVYEQPNGGHANGEGEVKEYAFQPTKRQRIIASIIAAIFAVAVLATIIVLITFNSYRRAPVSRGLVNMTEAYLNTAPSILAAMDRSVDPCVDFYAYSCNGWKKDHPIPADKQRWDKSFSTVNDQNTIARGWTVMEENWPMIGTMYKNCMDRKTIDAKFLTPVRDFLFLIDSSLQAPSPDAVATLIGRFHGSGVGLLFSASGDVDLRDPGRIILELAQGGLTLPTPDHYSSAEFSNLWPGYKTYISNILRMTGEPLDLTAAAESVFQLEKDLANHTLSRTALRDPAVYYNPKTLAQLDTLTGGKFVWEKYFQALGLPARAYETLVVQSLPFIGHLQNVLDASSAPRMNAFRLYAKFKLIHGLSDYLSQNISDLSFQYRKLVLNVTDQPERSKWCTSLVSSQLPDIVARLFVLKTFSESAKNKSRAMIVAIEEQFENMISSSAWMDESTKAKAVEKLHLISNKVGYPSSWKDYSEIFIKPKQFLDNLLTLASYSTAKELAQIGLASDRSEWLMNAFEVNAYYFSLWNEIVFPAGIMQPPFFHEKFPDAVNFGGLGSVVGHEISHGFDDKGRQFDGTGQYTQWWSNSAIEAFQTNANCIRDLYSSFTIEGAKVDGQLTLGENIADAGGVKASHKAFLDAQEDKSIAQRSHETTLARRYFDLSNEQLFFVSYAQNWCSNERPAYLAIKVKTDPHSPAMFRTNAPLSNYDEFSRVFNCHADSPMNRAKKCVVW